ncbi:MAG: hypothetical protein J0H64_05480, partial [Actinobacteria bacterium]|nr:hypothetical protein [Actinomycetota bacterium]
NPMKITTRLTRTAAGVAVAALAATGLSLAAAPAQAAEPVFSQLTLEHSVSSYLQEIKSGPGCTFWTPDTSKVPGDIPMLANTTKSSSLSFSQEASNKVDQTDGLKITGSEQGTARATTQGSNPKSIELSFAGKAQVAANPKTPESKACSAAPSVDMTFRYVFTSTQPLWATLSYTKAGPSYAEAWISAQSSDESEELYGWASKGSGSSTIYLPAGSYSGYVAGNPSMSRTAKSKTISASGNVKITFAPVGSAISGPSGKAQSYAALAKTRSCSTHTLSAKLTTSSKKIKRISKVSFSVNGKTVKTLRGKAVKRGKAVILRLNDGSPASVKTTVRFKTGKSYSATANYRACS